MSNSISLTKRNDKWIPWMFVLFFGVVALLDGIFVTIAIRTNTGLVTDKAYEKGLEYNKILEQAAAQKKANIVQKAIFENGILSWKLSTKDNRPINDALIKAYIFHPAQEGNDFEISLIQKGNGLYEARPQFPVKGLWTARLEAQWQDPRSGTQIYKTTLNILVP